MVAILESIVSPNLLYLYIITVYVAIYGNHVASLRTCAQFKDLAYDTRFDIRALSRRGVLIHITLGP